MNHLRLDITEEKENLLIDDNVINERYCIDYWELVNSALSDGEYEILTCGCGEAGCAGLFDPIIVTSDQNHVYWHIIEPKPERRFTFEKSEYINSLKDALDHILRLLPEDPKSAFIGPYGFYRSTFEELRHSL